MPAIDGETYPLRLRHVDRLKRSPFRFDEVGLVVGLLHWDGRHTIVVDTNDFLCFEIEDGVETFDGVSVEILVLVEPQPREDMREMPAILAFDSKIARVDTDLRHVRYAALLACRDELRIGADDLLDGDELLKLDHRPLVGQFL